MRHATEPAEHHVDGVSPRIDEEVDLISAVVHGVEPPRGGNRVQTAKRPLTGDVPNHERRENARPQERFGDRRVELMRDEPVDHPCHDAQRCAHEHGGQQSIEEVITKVSADPRSKNLTWTQREQTLQGHEEDRQDGQPKAKPERSIRSAWKCRARDSIMAVALVGWCDVIGGRVTRWVHPSRLWCRSLNPVGPNPSRFHAGRIPLQRRVVTGRP